MTDTTLDLVPNTAPGPGTRPGKRPPGALRRACARVLEPLADGKAEWVGLAGGRTNRVWRIGDAVVKLFASQGGSPMFPNASGTELRALMWLSGTGLAPQPLAAGQVPEGGFVVCRAVDGTVLDRPNQTLIQSLAALHHTAARPGMFPVWPAGHRAAMSLGHALLEQLHPTMPVRQLMRAGASLQAPGKLPPPRRALLHRDAVAGNAVISGRHAVLIDWQCPALGDPAEDLAQTLSPGMQRLHGKGAVDRDTVLSTYPDPDVVDRYLALAPAFGFRMAAYCLWRAAHGAPDYIEGARAECAALGLEAEL